MDAVKALKYSKAPGRDGIPAEIYKLACKGKMELGENPMLFCIHKLIKMMFHFGEVPDIWDTSDVVSIP